MPGRDPLPDDVKALKRIVIGREELIEQLTAEIHRLRRWRFGRSSEKVVAGDDQLGLALSEQAIQAANDASQEARIAAQDSAQQPPAASRGRRSAGRHDHAVALLRKGRLGSPPLGHAERRV